MCESHIYDHPPFSSRSVNCDLRNCFGDGTNQRIERGDLQELLLKGVGRASPSSQTNQKQSLLLFRSIPLQSPVSKAVSLFDAIDSRRSSVVDNLGVNCR